MTRFGVPQMKNGVMGIRAIDDGRGNGANAATRMAETVTHPHFYFPAVIARAQCASALAQGFGSCLALLVSLLDLAMA